MRIPVEVIFYSQIVKGGVFEGKGSTGRWMRKGKVVAEWKRGKDGQAVVTWHQIKDHQRGSDAQAG